MCGVTGFCDFSKKLSREHLIASTNVLRHRGPDWGGVEFFEHPDANIGLGHRRLSIIDVSPLGNQPMFSENKNIAIIFNGELYNFREIRKELEAAGHCFYSGSDTEVVIKSYQQYGIQAVHKFIGMFAFVLLDLQKQVIYLFRDRTGIKPLHYYYKNDCFLFASELKSLCSYPVFEKKLNKRATALFFKYGYITAPDTIFDNTFKVRPGHYVSIQLNNKKVEDIAYYDMLNSCNQPKLKITEEEAITETEKLFASAFQYRMVSDVEVGIFLSGGYDSSVVTALLQKSSSRKIKTFTIGFHEENYNEAPHAKKVAQFLGTDHHEYYCTAKNAQEIFNSLSDIYDEPLGDSSAIPTILVSRFARSMVTVCLSADGGDELFAGYEKYDRLQQIFNASEKLTHKDYYRIADQLARYYSDQELQQLLPGFDASPGLYDNAGIINEENDAINTCLALDFKTYLADDILAKVDRATMSVGLESREPLLDHRLVEFVSRLPSSFKYREGNKKHILKKIAHQYIPAQLLNKPKAGFTIPLCSWLTTVFREELMHYLGEKELRAHGIVNVKKGLAIRDDFINGKNTNHIQVWFLLMFQVWCRKWL